MLITIIQRMLNARIFELDAKLMVNIVRFDEINMSPAQKYEKAKSKTSVRCWWC